MIRKSFNFKTKSDEFVEDSDYFYIKGYASTFDEDLDGDKILPNAFVNSINKKQSLPILWQHQRKEPIGRSTILKEDSKGLYVEGRFPRKDSLVKNRVIPQMEIGNINEMSIGFRIIKDSLDRENNIRLIEELDINEFSLVSMAANPNAVVTDFKGLKQLEELKTITEVENFIRDKGLSRNESKFIISKIKNLQREAEEKERDALIIKSINEEIANMVNNLTTNN